jgi:betaine reductase
MSANPVVRGAAYCLAHVPDLVRYGSKPRREISVEPSLESRIAAALRDYARAVAYPPDQVFVGNLEPEALRAVARPWYATPAPGAGELARLRRGPFGEIADEETFYGLLAAADVLVPRLFELTKEGARRLERALRAHPLFAARADALPAPDDSAVAAAIESGQALELRAADTRVGCFSRDLRAEGRDDENLTAHHLLENLCSKASGALALAWLLEQTRTDAARIDYLISCGEEACGDRYQRGGGGMAKAIGQMVGCARASGMDVKNFCAAPASALVTAAALVKAGVYRRVAVVGGGSLAKLGMKFQAFLAHGMPILEDVLASIAFLVSEDDGASPVLRLEPGAVGLAPIGASASDDAVYRSFLLGPLAALGLRIGDVDRFAPELHNPEIMELAGSGDVVAKNYRTIAAMAVVAGEIRRDEMTGFIERVGMPGFAPDQGHVPSGVPYVGHAARAIARGELARVMFLSKASLFLGRCTDLYDGVSFLLERNPALARRAEESRC